jgi:RimJ/RimL family protein N-acetyltransferase
VIRPVRPEDCEELATLYAANREFLAPFEPVRPPEFFTADGQRERLRRQLHRVEAATLVGNVPSQRVLEKNGFERIGLARRLLRIGSDWRDFFLYERLADD